METPEAQSDRDQNAARAIASVIIKHQIKAAELTEKQFVEALRQAIASGDFIRYVAPGNKQAVIYAPFAEKQKLLARIQELENLLTTNNIIIPTT